MHERCSTQPGARVARHRREVAIAGSLERPESAGPSAWRGLDESGETTRTDVRVSPAVAAVKAAAPLEQRVEILASSAQRVSINCALDLRQKADAPVRAINESAVGGAATGAPTDFEAYVATPRGPATLRGLD